MFRRHAGPRDFTLVGTCTWVPTPTQLQSSAEELVCRSMIHEAAVFGHAPLMPGERILKFAMQCGGILLETIVTTVHWVSHLAWYNGTSRSRTWHIPQMQVFRIAARPAFIPCNKRPNSAFSPPKHISIREPSSSSCRVRSPITPLAKHKIPRTSLKLLCGRTLHSSWDGEYFRSSLISALRQRHFPCWRWPFLAVLRCKVLEKASTVICQVCDVP